VSVFLNNQSNATEIASALISYFNQTAPTEIVTPEDIEYAVSRLNISVNSSINNGFIMSQPPSANVNNIPVGAIFLSQSGGEIVGQQSQGFDTNTNISVGGVYSFNSYSGIDFLRMLLIDSPNEYRNVTDTQNRTLGSSVVVANVQTNTMQPPSQMNISLYYRIRQDFVSGSIDNINVYCSFYDTDTKSWNDTGCSMPIYNALWDRYECSCNHLTSFALLWLPKTSSSNNSLDAQDIASLVFQSVSILCFLIIMAHALYHRFAKPHTGLRPRDSLPLISNAAAMLLFIFYIALGLTVYTSPITQTTDVCFLSASVLMFFVYFFLILMFCIKTSIAYFNYLNFVHLFPAPSFRQLHITLTASFIISIAYVAFAAGFNSNSSYVITQLYAKKICWFTRSVIHYFVTIPICICLFLNIVMLIFVAKRLIAHARNATASENRPYERMKRCVLILIASCVAQGIGWLLGPFLSFADEETANILGWIFVVCNGLEGFWTVLLYYLLRRMRVDEQKRQAPAKVIKDKEKLKTKQLRDNRRDREEVVPRTEPDQIERRRARRAQRSFDDIPAREDQYY
jgi:hypothetical protein